MASQEIDHALLLMSSANIMRTRNFICDFKIEVGSTTFNVHRLILAAHSEYFRALFSAGMKEAQQGYTVMDTDTIDPIAMQKCIEYMYTSKCDMQTDCKSILRLANYLQILKLQEICFKHLLETMSPENCLSVLNMARTYRNQTVQKAAENVIVNNMEIVMSTSLFQYINRQDLLSFIKHSHASDETSWKATTTWLSSNWKEIHLVLEQYDFSTFQPHFLLNIVLKESYVSKSTKLTAHVLQAIFSDSSKLENSLTSANCFQFLKHASDNDSKRIIMSFIKTNALCIIAGPQFSFLAKQELICLIESPEVKPEIKWDAIVRWVNHSPDERKCQFSGLFGFINLEKLSVSFIEEHIRPEKLVEDDPICMKLLVDSLIKHAKASDTQTQKVSVMRQPANGEIHKGKTFIGDFIVMRVIFPARSEHGIQYPRFSQSFIIPGKNIQRRLIKAFHSRRLFKLHYNPDSKCGQIQIGDIPLESGNLDEGYHNRLLSALSKEGF